MRLDESTAAFQIKAFYRFTGPPEHWLTAIKFFTWGLKAKYLKAWQKIEVGDVFFMHSTLKSRYKNARSRIIGIGIVGPGLRQKENYLWEEEFTKRENIYPLLIPFSEIYLFSTLADLGNWNFDDTTGTEGFVQQLIGDARSLPSGFPVMGSFSRVDLAVAMQVISAGMPANIKENKFDLNLYRATPTKLIPVKNALETLRFVPTLKYIDADNSDYAKRQSAQISIIERDNELLEKANQTHRQIIDSAISILQKEGYDTLANMHADLVAENENEILLFEAKSIPEDSFRPQARRAVGQLYQYEYFDIGNHQAMRGSEKPVSKILLIPDDPGDVEYISFLRWADISTRMPHNGKIILIQ